MLKRAHDCRKTAENAAKALLMKLDGSCGGAFTVAGCSVQPWESLSSNSHIRYCSRLCPAPLPAVGFSLACSRKPCDLDKAGGFMLTAKSYKEGSASDVSVQSTVRRDRTVEYGRDRTRAQSLPYTLLPILLCSLWLYYSPFLRITWSD